MIKTMLFVILSVFACYGNAMAGDRNSSDPDGTLLEKIEEREKVAAMEKSDISGPTSEEQEEYGKESDRLVKIKDDSEIEKDDVDRFTDPSRLYYY